MGVLGAEFHRIRNSKSGQLGLFAPFGWVRHDVNAKLFMMATHRPKVVPFWGSYLEIYKGIPKRNYFGAYG